MAGGKSRDSASNEATMLHDLPDVAPQRGTKEEPFEGGVFDDGFVEGHGMLAILLPVSVRHGV